MRFYGSSAIEQIKELFEEISEIATSLHLPAKSLKINFQNSLLLRQSDTYSYQKLCKQIDELISFSDQLILDYAKRLSDDNTRNLNIKLARQNKESLLQNEETTDKGRDLKRLNRFRNKEMREMLPKLQNYISNCGEMWDIIYEHKQGQLPSAVRDTVNGAVFDGPMYNYKEWSEARLESGWIAHMMALYMQIFRNSDEAKQIANFYSSLGPSGKLELEKDLKELVGSDPLFEFMFAMPMIPFILDPRERPTNYATSPLHQNVKNYNVFNKDGKVVFSGNYDAPYGALESTNFYAYDATGNNYYESGQPNFQFLIYYSSGRRVEEFFWKNYLLHKGSRSFYYQHKVLDEEQNKLVVPDGNELDTNYDDHLSFTLEQLTFLYHFYGIHVTDEWIVDRYNQLQVLSE